MADKKDFGKLLDKNFSKEQKSTLDKYKQTGQSVKSSSAPTPSPNIANKPANDGKARGRVLGSDKARSNALGKQAKAPQSDPSKNKAQGQVDGLKQKTAKKREQAQQKGKSMLAKYKSNSGAAGSKKQTPPSKKR